MGGDLRAHRCLIYTLRGSRWSFRGPRGDEFVQVSGPLLSNNGLALRRAAVAGLGVAMLPEFLVGQLLVNRGSPRLPEENAMDFRSSGVNGIVRGGAGRGSPVLAHDVIRRDATMSTPEARPPFPPFTLETAIQKVRLAEDAWNSRDPERVSLAYSEGSRWRNRAEFLVGRDEIRRFLARKWQRELSYRLIKELWAHDENRIAVRFAYEWHSADGDWFRAYGNENWEFDQQGLMRQRHASINDLPIAEHERKFHWPEGRRPDDHPGLSELGL